MAGSGSVAGGAAEGNGSRAATGGAGVGVNGSRAVAGGVAGGNGSRAAAAGVAGGTGSRTVAAAAIDGDGSGADRGAAAFARRTSRSGCKTSGEGGAADTDGVAERGGTIRCSWTPTVGAGFGPSTAAGTTGVVSGGGVGAGAERAVPSLGEGDDWTGAALRFNAAASGVAR